MHQVKKAQIHKFLQVCDSFQVYSNSSILVCVPDGSHAVHLSMSWVPHGPQFSQIDPIGMIRGMCLVVLTVGYGKLA